MAILRRRITTALLTGAGAALYGSGVFLMLLSVALVPAAAYIAGELMYAVVYILAILAGGFGGCLLAYAGARVRRAGARIQRDNAVLDNAPPVVYLRPFAADVIASATPPVRLGKVDTHGLSTHEENLASVFQRAGQFVAISEPWAGDSPLGALRLSVNDTWQRTVLDLLSSARLIVLRCGTSAGIEWELGQVLQRCAPARVIILLSANLADARREHAMLAARLPYPPPPLSGIWSEQEGLAGICIFDEGWKPRLRLFRAVGRHRSLVAPIVPALTFAVQPVFARLEIPWKAPPMPAHIRMAIGLLTGLVFAPVAILYFWGHPFQGILFWLAAIAAVVSAVSRMATSKSGGLHVLEIDAAPPVHPLYEAERGLLRIVNAEAATPVGTVIIIADGHRIAELNQDDREIVLDMAVGRHSLTVGFSANFVPTASPIQCDVTAVGCTTVVCTWSAFSSRPLLRLES